MQKKYLALSAPAVLLLAGCSGDGLGDTSALSGVDVHITEDGAPEVLLQDGAVEAEEESSIVIDGGEGDDVDPSQILEVSTAAVDPASGAVQQETFSEDSPALLHLPLIQDQSEFIYDSLTETDSQVGSQIALYEPATEGDPDDQMAMPTPESLIILRIDDQYPAHAHGEPQEQSGDLPAVTGGEGEPPELSDPEQDVETPEETQSEVLIAGDGEEVSAEDQVVAQYTGWRASDGTVFDSSWAGVEPEDPAGEEEDEADSDQDGADSDQDANSEEDAADSDEDISEPLAQPLDSLVPGWAQGLEGQQVGSRVLLVIPPEHGYGEAEEDTEEEADDGAPPNELEGETLIFAVDIIATAPVPEEPEQPEQPEQPELSEEEIEELIEQMEGEVDGAEDAESETDDSDGDDAADQDDQTDQNEETE